EVDVADEVGHCRIGQDRLRLPASGAEYAEATLACLVHCGQPQSGLPDTGLALDDQSRRLSFCRQQEVSNRPKFGRTADHPQSLNPTHSHQQTQTTSTASEKWQHCYAPLEQLDNCVFNVYPKLPNHDQQII